jgi:hypothetical protein
MLYEAKAVYNSGIPSAALHQYRDTQAMPYCIWFQHVPSLSRRGLPYDWGTCSVLVHKPELSSRHARLTRIDRTLLAHTLNGSPSRYKAAYKAVFVNQTESYPAFRWGLVTWWSVKDPLAKHAKF